MAPGPGLDAGLSTTIVATEESKIGRGQEQPGSRPVKKSAPTNLETPVQDYEDATQVPDEFVIKDPTKIPTRGWGEHDASQTALGDVDLPLIDLLPLTMDADQRRPVAEEAAKKVITEIGTACEEWVFFQVVNHGIPESVMDRFLEAAFEFFRLPQEEKQLYAPAPGKIDGPLMEEYSKGVERILQVLWTSLSQYLGLESTTLQKKAQEDGSLFRMRVNYYPKCPEPEKVIGLASHKDFGCMTVLLQDAVGGLQVQKPGTDVWVDVKPKKGSLVINIANQVEILSNGKFKSAVHRALVNRVKPRLTIAAFSAPGPNCVIGPLQELLDKTQQLPQYK